MTTNFIRRYPQLLAVRVSASLFLMLLTASLLLPTHYYRLILPVARAATFTVTTTVDNGNNVSPTPGSLRQAIVEANATPGADVIAFNIPGGGVQTIAPIVVLPNITESVTIDGYTQPGAAANTLAAGNDAILLIELSGASAGPGNGLVVLTAANNSTIRGLVINRFTGVGINIIANNVAVEGCFIGTNPTGSVALGNGGGGINISGNFAGTGGNNRVGGTSPAQRNLISGNANSGVVANSNLANTIQGNYIGTSASGNADLGNSGYGIAIGTVGGGAPIAGATIGGATGVPGTGAGNVISGNGLAGISLTAFPNTQVGGATIQGNVVGLNASSTAALGNDGTGVFIQDENIGGLGSGSIGQVTVGGSALGARNIVSANGAGPGVAPGILTQANNTVIQGNYVGTDITGTLDLGNDGDGISVFGGNVLAGGALIGGSTAASRNIISGNEGHGIRVASSTATIQGNFIGTQADGANLLRNSKAGALVDGSLASIGGASSGEGNTIAYNSWRGIDVVRDSSRATILANSIFSNGAFQQLGEQGIDLIPLAEGGGGIVTPNDPGDADTGPNNLQNFPVINSATSVGGSTTIQGSLNSLPNAQFRIEFFAGQECDPSGNGEGQIFLGFQNITTDAAGNATINATLLVALSSGQVVTATATLLDNTGAPVETSEFSQCVTVTGTIAPAVIQFSQAGYTVGESGANATITITRSGNTASAVTVDYSTSDDTATAGSDYTAASGTLIFASGETSKIFNVAISDDTLDEPDETVNLVLSNPTGGATLGTPFAALLTILDDDAPPQAAATTVALASSLNPSAVGDSVTFTATVNGVSPGTGTPSGVVQFFEEALLLGDGALSGGVASFSISSLTAGSHTITAVYGGDSGFMGSTSAALVQVVGALTPVGLNVPVTLMVGQTTIRLIFTEVTEAGVTTAHAIDRCGIPVPPPIRVDTNSRAFEISTTARFRPEPPPILPGGPTPPPIAPAIPDPPPIRLSFQMPFVSTQAAFNSLRVVHYSSSGPPPTISAIAPQDSFIPTDPCSPQGGPIPPPINPQIQLSSHNFVTRTITANLVSLSPFLIAPTTDITAPTTAALSASPNGYGWHNSDVNLTLMATDNAGGAGVYAITYSATGAQTISETTVAGASALLTINTQGTTVITFYATDLAANIETAQTLTIRLDKTPPTVVCPSNTTRAAGASCQAAVPDVKAGVIASDNFTAAGSLIITQQPAVGTMVGAGAHTVIITVTDEAGNATTCTTTFTVTDSQPPTIFCPTNMATTAPAGSSSAVVNYATPQPSDNCPGSTVNCLPPSGSAFPLGATTVVCTAIDAAGNTAACSFTVTVNSAPPVSSDRIAFESLREGNLDVYVMNVDGSNQTRLTFNAGADANPAWSPDRSRIAFTTLRNGNLDIYVMNADGSNQTRLTNNSAIDDGPAWSPDGTKIAFWSSRNGNAEIYVMNSDGTGQTRITNNSRTDIQPEWSPDGSKIAFTSDRASLLNFDIYVMSANGSGVTRLTSHSAADDSPSWSADGMKIAFTSNRTGLLDFEIWVMNANGTSPVQLTSAANTSMRPSWSRDGSKIAFATNRHGLVNFEIYTMNSNGSNQARLTTNAVVDFAAHW